MSNQKWEKERPLLSDYLKKSNGVLLLSTVSVRSGRKGRRWLTFGMFWLCLGGIGEMPLPSSVFGSPILLMPAAEKFPSMLIDTPTVFKSFMKSSPPNNNDRDSPVPGKAQIQNTARSPTTSPLMAQGASEKEKDAPVVREAQEKETMPSNEAEAVEKNQVPAVAPETKEKENMSPVEGETQEKSPPVIREAQEKEKTSSEEAEDLKKEKRSSGETEPVEKEQITPVAPEGQEKEKASQGESRPLEKEQAPPVAPKIQEKEKTSPIEFNEKEKGKTPPVLVPGVPEKEKKAPPILVPEVPEKDNGQAIKSYKTKIQETRDLIRTIDEGRLTREQHDTFNSINSFLEKSQEAFSQDDMSMAVNLAEKAHTLAKEIVRNSTKE